VLKHVAKLSAYFNVNMHEYNLAMYRKTPDVDVIIHNSDYKD
jgi:hypothetical protein